MNKVLVFLTTDFSGGGGSQYEQSILQGLLNLPAKEYELIILYVNEGWVQYLPMDRNCIKVYDSCYFVKMLIKLLVAIKFPIRLIQYVLSRYHPVAHKIRSMNADINIVPYPESFWTYLTDAPMLGVIHDLMHRYERRFPEVSSNGRYIYRDRHFNYVCIYSRGVLVDSEFGKKQLHESFLTPLNKIFVLPYIAPKYIYNNVCQSDINLKYSLPDKYIFYPAQFWLHKNHNRLIRAISLLVRDIPDIQLVCVGSYRNSYKNIMKLILSLGIVERVHLLGLVPNEDIFGLYKRARAMVMPTFFGPTNIPPLEAFVVGCPVGISNVYGIPEQVGDAALLFDPNSVDEIANVVRTLWTDDDMCLRLARKGKENIQKWGQKEFDFRLLTIINTLIGTVNR